MLLRGRGSRLLFLSAPALRGDALRFRWRPAWLQTDGLHLSLGGVISSRGVTEPVSTLLTCLCGSLSFCCQCDVRPVEKGKGQPGMGQKQSAQLPRGKPVSESTLCFYFKFCCISARRNQLRGLLQERPGPSVSCVGQRLTWTEGPEGPGSGERSCRRPHVPWRRESPGPC